VRVAVLLQPVAGIGGSGMATVQVAETLELREALARELLVSTLWRQLVLIGVIVAVVLWVVQRAVRPIRRLSEDIELRADNDLRALDAQDAPRELQPLVQANNHLMQRLEHLLQHQKRFVRDAAHQLRTPLAVLKAQTQSAQRGDVPPQQAFGEIAQTIDRATTLSNQMLSLAKVEQLKQEAAREGKDTPLAKDWAVIARELAIELAPLMAERELDFSIATESAAMAAHEWMLRELTRNLLHNAIGHSPRGAALSVELRVTQGKVTLLIRDAGSGIDDELRKRLFQPFSRGAASASGVAQGAGLGLAICSEIIKALGGELSLDNRMLEGRVIGLDARVVLAISP
jgi:two-component system, OmpR family, sensor histidine kinase TctE